MTRNEIINKIVTAIKEDNYARLSKSHPEHHSACQRTAALHWVLRMITEK